MGKCFIASLVLTLFAIVITGHCVAAEERPLKIVNGTTANDGEFPYMVQLISNGSFSCGGSIIGEEWILTSGKCVNFTIDSIVFGTNKLSDVSTNNSIDVSDMFQHPMFHKTIDQIPWYDVGVLRLKQKIPFSDKAKPIKLADSNATIPFHVQGVLCGWGYDKTGSIHPMENLQKIQLQLLTDQECIQIINDYSGRDSFNSTHNLCSDDYYNGECYGDSGSPYVINGTQYGVVSWSYKPCGIVPGTYSRITNPEYRDWIRKVANI